MRPDIAGAPRTLTPDEAGAIYDLLVREAGARDGDVRGDFTRYATKDRFVEWRFMGSLGFGGKLYSDGRSVPRIGCYREHETPDRLATIERVNAALIEMFETRQQSGGADAPR